MIHLVAEGIKIKHPGAFTEWCKKRGYKGANCSCICEGMRAKSEITRKRAYFAYNFGFKSNGKKCECAEKSIKSKIYAATDKVDYDIIKKDEEEKEWNYFVDEVENQLKNITEQFIKDLKKQYGSKWKEQLRLWSKGKLDDDNMDDLTYQFFEEDIYDVINGVESMYDYTLSTNDIKDIIIQFFDNNKYKELKEAFLSI